MQNIYPASWFYLTKIVVRLVFVKHHFSEFFVVVAVVVCLFVVAIVVVAFSLLLLFFNWYKLDCKFFAELWKFFPISNKVLIIITHSQ